MLHPLRVHRAALSGLVLAALLGGCAGQHAGGGDTVAIGIDMPVSGADTSDGVPTRNGALLAVEEAQAAHALGANIHIVANDLDDAVNGKHDPAQGAQNMKSFIADPRVLAVVGPFNSSVATAEIPLGNDAGLAQISPSVTADGMTRGDQALALRKSHPQTNAFFRVCASDSRQGTALGDFAKTLGYTRLFIIDDNETYGSGLATVFERRAKEIGLNVVGHEHITANQQDFKALLTKAAAEKPDMLFYGGTTSTGGGLLRKQTADAGLGDAGFMGGDGISDDEFINVAEKLANGAAYTVVAPDISKLPAADDFIKRYTARFHTHPGPYSANAYAAAAIEIAAIARAQKAASGKIPERSAVLAEVAATKNFATPIGLVGFDAMGDTTAPIVSLYRVADGKAKFVRQETVK